MWSSATKPRRNHSAQFKAKLAFEAAKEERIVAELSRQISVHLNQIWAWKTQLLEAAIDVLAYEVFAARDIVREALDAGNEVTAERAIAEIRTLWALFGGTARPYARRVMESVRFRGKYAACLLALAVAWFGVLAPWA